jgi:hypothetical protein
MADFNVNSEKGSVLMQQALKKYAKGDFEGGDKDRAEANRYYDLASAEINSEAGKITQLYGESRNFGIIYNVFEQNIENLLSTKKGKKIIKECYNLIKSNKVLNEQFKIYDMFEKAQNVDDVKDFVNEASNIVKTFDKKIVMENNEKLIKFIRDKKLDEYVDIPEETENLYEAIEYIVLHKKTYDNVNDFVKAQNVITEHIVKNQKNNIVENKITSVEFENKIEEIENEINEKINQEEKTLLDSFLTARKDKKKEVFENYKRKTLRKIKESYWNSDEADKIQWNKIYENISSKNFSENMSENITNCAEMMEICDTIDE